MNIDIEGVKKTPIQTSVIKTGNHLKHQKINTMVPNLLLPMLDSL